MARLLPVALVLVACIGSAAAIRSGPVQVIGLAWAPPTGAGLLPFGKHSTLQISSPDMPYLTCDIPEAGSLTGVAALDKTKKKVNASLPVQCDHETSPFPWAAFTSGFIIPFTDATAALPGTLPSGSLIVLSSLATRKACAPLDVDGSLVCNASSVVAPSAAFRVFLAGPMHAAPAAGAPWPVPGGAPTEVNLLHVLSNKFCAPASEAHEPLRCDVDAATLGSALPPVLLLKPSTLWPAPLTDEAAGMP